MLFLSSVRALANVEVMHVHTYIGRKGKAHVFDDFMIDWAVL